MRALPHTITMIRVLVLLMFTGSLMGQNAFFREGYVITRYNDTIHGLIKNTSCEEIRFRDTQKHEQTFIPPDLKGYFRCNMNCISVMIPGDTVMLFLAHLQTGVIDLFATIRPEGSVASGTGAMVGGLLGSLIAAANDGPAGSPGAGVYSNGCEKEYYSIGAFYLGKGAGDTLRKVPNGRKKFNSFMIPLLRDHLEVVREIPEDMFVTGNLVSIIRQYNAAVLRKSR